MHDTRPSPSPTIAAAVRQDTDRILSEIAGGMAATDPFAAAVRATRMPMIVTDPRQDDNPIIYVNEAFCRLTGYGHDEIIGRNCRFLQGPGTDPDDIARIRTAVAAREKIEIAIFNYRKDGSAFWNQLLLAPVKDAAGEVAYFFASQYDVTMDYAGMAALQGENAALAREHAVSRERLRYSEMALPLATEAAEIGLWDVDCVNDTLFWPPRVKAMFGIAPDAPVTMADYYAGLHLDDREACRIAFAAAIDPEKRALFDVEYRTVGKQDGVIRWVAAKGRGLFDDDDRCLRLIGTAIDITARKRSEQALRESEMRFRNMADNAPVMMWVTDTDGSCTYLNHLWYAYTGQSEVEGLGFGWLDAVHPEDRGWSSDLFRAANAKREPFRVEYRLKGMDGQYRWFIDTAQPRLGADGSFLGYIGSVVDIHDRKVTEQRLAETSRRLDAILNNTTQAIFLMDERQYCSYMNAAAERLTGFTLEETQGRALHDIVHHTRPDGSPYPLCECPIDQAFPENNQEQGEEVFVHKDGSFYPVGFTASPIRNDHGQPIGTVIEARHIEEELRAKAALDAFNATLEQRVAEEIARRETVEEALRQSQKMEAVGQLTGGLAHDFNNLLAGISGSLELMQTRMQQGRLTDVDRYMTAAQGAAKRAAALTHRLLAFSRRQTLDPKPTNVNRLAADIQELIQRTVGPGIPIEVVGATGAWPALVDPSQLENALLNLCINARDAMPDGGKIIIETANKWMDERAARQHDVPEGQYLSVCVTDTGTGMPPEVMARVFEPFFTTKPIGEGTGLGLSMIYGFAQQSGGQVRIYSEVGHGTTVCIYLPRHYGEVAEDEGANTVTDVPRSEQGEIVLIVDDEPTVRMLVTDILEDLGYTAIEAADSAAGLRVLQSDVRIDLLITDVGLPGGMNGRQMADAARTARPDLKVLFITGYAENAILGNGHLSPGMAVLTKPFAIETMAARIRSMIEAGREQAHSF
jgi:PAS domain S-box-containing protein